METLTFEDFLCYSDNTNYEIAYNPVFEEMFREQYELAGLDEDYAYSVYMKELLESGEFDHEMQQPVLEFLSAGLDIVSFGLKPLIEAFLGENLVTGDNLTDTDRFLSGVEGIIGLITFGSIWSKLGVIGIEGVTAELAQEVITDSASTMTSEGLNELGVNGTVSTLAGMAVGGLTASSMDDMLDVRLGGSRMEVAEPEEVFQFRFDDQSRHMVDEELALRQVDYDDVLELRSRDALQSVGEECGKTIESGLDSGLTQSQIEDIVNTPKGSRPDPSSYLSQEYIDAHLAQFDDGASIIMTKEQYINYVKGNSTIGIPTDGTQFVLPKNYCDDIASKAAGNIGYYEKALGFDTGHFSDGGGLVRIDIENLDGLNLRIPSGNEAGANSHWIPGGKTDGGVPEAISDLIPNVPNNVTVSEIK